MLRPTGLLTFAQAFPDRVYDVGIAEQHAVTSAAGLAMAGMKPVVAVYSTFLNRAFDQVLMDVALHRLPVTFAEATLGADVKVPTLDGPVTVRIPPGTPSGKTLRVRGRGVQADGHGKAGDLLVTVDVQVPVNLNSDQRGAVEALAQTLDEDPRAALFAAAASQHRRKTDATSDQ